jgi:hypothetical protein
VLGAGRYLRPTARGNLQRVVDPLCTGAAPCIQQGPHPVGAGLSACGWGVRALRQAVRALMEGGEVKGLCRGSRYREAVGMDIAFQKDSGPQWGLVRGAGTERP